MILRKETETFFIFRIIFKIDIIRIRMNDTPQGDGNCK